MLGCRCMHIFSEHYCLNFANPFTDLLQHSPPFLPLYTCTHTHTQVSSLFLSSFTKMCTDNYKTALHLWQLLPSSLVGEMWSVLANTGHRDLRPHPGHSAGHSGAGHLLCQDLRSLQGSMTCAVRCNEVILCIDLLKYLCVLVCVFALDSVTVCTWYNSLFICSCLHLWPNMTSNHMRIDSFFFFFFLLFHTLLILPVRFKVINHTEWPIFHQIIGCWIEKSHLDQLLSHLKQITCQVH